MLFPIRSALIRNSLEKSRFDHEQKHQSIKHYVTLSNMSKHLDLNVVFQYKDRAFLHEMVNNEDYTNYLHPLIERRQDLNYWKDQIKQHLTAEKQALIKLQKGITILRSTSIEQHQRTKLLQNLKPNLARLSAQVDSQLNSLEDPQQLKNLYLNQLSSISRLNQSIDSIEQFFDRTHGSNHIEKLKGYLISNLY